jgi:hypothetical protein
VTAPVPAAAGAARAGWLTCAMVLALNAAPVWDVLKTAY